jgi:hypothetical protein
MRLEAEKENAEREVAKLRKLNTAEQMVDAIAKTRQRFVDQVMATSEENHRLHKEAEAEASELRAQLRAKMAEACELRDGATRQVCEHDRERRQLEQERDAFRDQFQALQQEGERRSGECAAQHAKLSDDLRAQVERQKATIASYRKDKAEQINELGKVRRELAETKKALADMKGYKQDEYVAAQELQTELEHERLKCYSYVAERDAARHDLSTAKAELARCQALANGNHEKWQWAKEDAQRVSKLARAHFIKWQAAEVENESLKRMLSEEGGEKHRLQLEREREEHGVAMKLPMGNVRNAAVAKCFNSGVLPGASAEEVLASERMTASIVEAKAAVEALAWTEAHVLETNKGPW